MTDLHGAALATITGWAAPDPLQEGLRQGYLEHLRTHRDGVWRECVPAHLTASTLVLDADCARVLLTLHRRGGFWCQFGGHCEPDDPTLADAALREGREESGLADLRLLPGPVELSRHRLSPAFRPCGEHLDVRYAAVAPHGSTPVVSGESHDVAWWPVSDLPPGSVGELDLLVVRAIAAEQASRRA